MNHWYKTLRSLGVRAKYVCVCFYNTVCDIRVMLILLLNEVLITVLNSCLICNYCLIFVAFKSHHY